MYYSVPYEYIKQKVDVRMTRSTVEVFYDGNRICSHRRLYGRANQYSTIEEHMPPNHQQYVRWNGDRFRKWAEKIGSNTETVISAILGGYKVEQQGYKACYGAVEAGRPEKAGKRLQEGLDLHTASLAQEYTGYPFFRAGQGGGECSCIV